MIEDYEFGRIVIDGQTYTSDVIIFPDHVQRNWWRREGHELCLADLDTVWEAQPEVLVVGTGYAGLMRVLPEVEQEAKARGVRLVVRRTGEARHVYNNLLKEGKRVVAALHLTC